MDYNSMGGGVCNSQREYKFARYFVLSIFLLILANPIIAVFDLTNLAVALSVLALIIVTARGISVQNMQNSLPALAYIVVTIFLMLFSILRLHGVIDPIVYVALLTLWPLFWIILLSRYGVSLVFDVLPQVYFLVAVVSVVALIQYFLSPTLWGLINYSSLSLQWASNIDFEGYSTFFRVSSLVGSPQVLSVLCAFFAILLILDPSVRIIIKIIYLILYFAAGLLTGSKATLFLITIALSLMFITSFVLGGVKRSFIMATVTILFFAILIAIFYEEIVTISPVIGRVFDIQAAIEQEQGDSRFQRLVISFATTNPLVGHGYTQQLFSTITGFRAAESFLAKMYFHFGLLPVIALLFFLLSAITRSSGQHVRMIRFTVIIVFTSMWITTALEATILFPIWGILIAGLMSRSRLDVINLSIKSFDSRN
jgi:hypothetical protein